MRFFIFLLSISIIFQVTPKHVIGSRPVGFFSNFLGVLNHLNWCDKTNTPPVVYWNSQNLYYVPGYHSSGNVWEYYFEQISPLSYQYPDRIHSNFEAPDGFYLTWMGEAYKQNFSPDLRKRMHYLITKYIHVKPAILKKITDFYKKNIEGKKTVAIQIRGTDKCAEARPIALSRFINTAANYPEYQFLIATDEARILQTMKSKLKGNVIYYDAYRSNDNKPIHHRNKALRGEEVLIEAILLSLCDVFIHSVSNVATGVLFFNPNLSHVFLQ